MMLRMAAISAILLLSPVVQAHPDARDNVFMPVKPMATLRASADIGTAGSAVQAPGVAVQVPGTAAPANDMFADRIMLYDATGTTPGLNVAATFEPGEPGTTFGSNSVWWSWIAPDNGWFTFDTLNSGFDTFLGVWQGSKVTELSLVASNDNYSSSTRSLCAFRAALGETYQIQVMGAGDGMQGAIVLRWSPVTWYLETMVTNVADQLVLLAANGAALNQWDAHIQLVQTGTNAWNTVYFVATNYPYKPITIVDKNNRLLVNKQVLPDMSTDARICDFNGMNVLVQTGVWQSTSGCLQLYAMKNAPLSTHTLRKQGEYFVANAAADAWLMRGGVLVYLIDALNNQEGLVWLQRTLKKVVWELPLAPGPFMYAFDNGLAVRTVVGAADVQCVVTRKARPLGTVTLPMPATGVLYARGDERGNILHWVREGLTNGPMTLVSYMNKQVFSGFAPAGFQDFDICLYNGKQLWFRRSTVGMGLAAQLQSYSVGSSPKLLGTAAVTGYAGGGLDGKKSFAYGVNSATTTVTGFSRKMKPAWSNSEIGLFDDYFGRGIYSIYVPGTTTFEYKMLRGSWFYADHFYSSVL